MPGLGAGVCDQPNIDPVHIGFDLLGVRASVSIKNDNGGHLPLSVGLSGRGCRDLTLVYFVVYVSLYLHCAVTVFLV